MRSHERGLIMEIQVRTVAVVSSSRVPPLLLISPPFFIRPQFHPPFMPPPSFAYTCVLRAAGGNPLACDGGPKINYRTKPNLGRVPRKRFCATATSDRMMAQYVAGVQSCPVILLCHTNQMALAEPDIAEPRDLTGLPPSRQAWETSSVEHTSERDREPPPPPPPPSSHKQLRAGPASATAAAAASVGFCPAAAPAALTCAIST